MTNSKRLIVLAGSGHKGVVKLSLTAGGARGSCALDFRPAGATLYLVGDEIAEIALKDINTTFEVPFLSNNNPSCLVRSSSLTMFGGDMPHSEIIRRIDSHLKSSRAASKKSDVTPTPSKCASENADMRQPTQSGKKENNVEIPQFDNASSGDVPKESSNGELVYDVPPTNDAPARDIPSTDQRQCSLTDDALPNRGENTIPNRENALPYRGAQKTVPQSGNSSDDAPKDPLKDWTRFDGNNFYYAVKPQLDEMFVRYPEDKLLATTVQNSEWVRVDAEDGAYSVGVLYDGSDPAFICYAVPWSFSERRPPAEIEGMCVWLPVSDPALKGYWVIYQSAKTGDIIK